MTQHNRDEGRPAYASLATAKEIFIQLGFVKVCSPKFIDDQKIILARPFSLPHAIRLGWSQSSPAMLAGLRLKS